MSGALKAKRETAQERLDRTPCRDCGRHNLIAGRTNHLLCTACQRRKQRNGSCSECGRGVYKDRPCACGAKAPGRKPRPKASPGDRLNLIYNCRHQFKLSCMESGECTHGCRTGQTCRRLPEELTDWLLLKKRLSNRARKLSRDLRTHGLTAAADLAFEATQQIEGLPS